MKRPEGSADSALQSAMGLLLLLLTLATSAPRSNVGATSLAAMSSGVDPGPELVSLRPEAAPLIRSLASALRKNGFAVRPAVVATVLTFLYVGCHNAAKCGGTARRIAALRDELRRRGALQRTQILLVTYEPQFDDAVRMGAFLRSVGVSDLEGLSLIRLDEDSLTTLLEELEAPVARDGGYVVDHGVRLYVLDAADRLLLVDGRAHGDVDAVLVGMQSALRPPGLPR